MLKAKRVLGLLLCLVLSLSLFGGMMAAAEVNPVQDDPDGWINLYHDGKPANSYYPSNTTLHLTLEATSTADNSPIELTDEDTCVLYSLDLDSIPNGDLSHPDLTELTRFSAGSEHDWTPADGSYYICAVIERADGTVLLGHTVLEIGHKDLSFSGTAFYAKNALYTGKAVKVPMYVIYMDFAAQQDVELVEGKDYTVTYKNNVKTGKATATVKGIGEYIGSILIEFSVAAPADNFVDVNKKAWYYGAVNFSAFYGLFEGMDATHFAPQTNMTRAMFVTVLSRLAGADVKNNVASPFWDVPTGKWYTGPVVWAYQLGIVEGVGDGAFAPDDNVTREQICKMMAEFCNVADVKLTVKRPAIDFKDKKNISGWAKQYVATCQRAGLVEGDKGYFYPKNNATRAEVATVFKNFCDNYLQYTYEWYSGESGFLPK